MYFILFCRAHRYQNVVFIDKASCSHLCWTGLERTHMFTKCLLIGRGGAHTVLNCVLIELIIVLRPSNVLIISSSDRRNLLSLLLFLPLLFPPQKKVTPGPRRWADVPLSDNVVDIHAHGLSFPPTLVVVGALMLKREHLRPYG